MLARLAIIVLSAVSILSYMKCSPRQQPRIGNTSTPASQVVQASGPVHTYSRWEYRIIPVNGRLESDGDLYGMKNALTSLGSEGWELVCPVEGYGSTTALLLKRPMWSKPDSVAEE